MNLFEALILGIVEGLTEYLPVSSTGHLIVAQRALGIPASEEANAFAIVIQAGAILAVLSMYRQRVGAMVAGVLGRDDAGRRLAIRVVLAFLPAVVLGLLFDDWIESVLFGLWPVVAAWVVGAALMLALGGRLHRGTVALEALTPQMAVWIGLAQCVAMWPGFSRSLATILGGVLVGLTLPAAVEFSFLLGVLTLGAATAYKGLDAGPAMLAAYGVAPMAVGLVASWASALLAVRAMLAWLQRRGLGVFAVWRLAMAAVVAGAITQGWM